MLVSERPGAARPPHAVARRRLCRGRRSRCCCSAAAAVARRQRRTGGRSTRWRRRSPPTSKTAAGLPLDPVADADLPRVLPLLDQARALPHGYDRGATDGWCLARASACRSDAKLAAGARAVYRHALERVLLPRLIWRLEAQMHGAIDRPDYLYEATRVYLMLGAPGRSTAIWCAPGWRSTGRPPIPALSWRRRATSWRATSMRCSPSRCRQIPLDGALLDFGPRDLQPRAARQPRLFPHRLLRRRASGPAVAPGRRAGRRRRARLRARLGQAADRRGSRLLHRRRLSQGAAAGARRCHQAGGERELGARHAAPSSLRTAPRRSGSNAM